MFATLSDIFEAKITTAAEALPLDEELALISRAQGGDEDAYNALLMQYRLGLRGLVRTEYARAGGFVDADETRANVLLGFAEALASCDGTTRLSAKLKGATLTASHEFHLVDNFNVPYRTRQRYMQALREAGPDGNAEEKAVELGMSPEVFRAIREALRAGSYEGMLDDGTGEMSGRSREASMTTVTPERAYAEVDDAILVARAFAAVGELEEGICRDAYGFTEYDPIPDAEIAHRRGMTRPTVQRVRTRALEAMREALGDAR